MFTFRNFVWQILSIILLIGCQTNNKNPVLTKKYGHVNKKNYINPTQDSAPKGPPPTKFKEVKPTNSPISRYGNPATYSVDGKQYDVMVSSKGYHARGLASWYGTKFHTKRTSSGEKYDMYALTAAHKTLPLPTYVRVKNLENNKVAIIKVNDRGPFHTGRILDLSYGAANRLGIFPKGTAMVEIDVIANSSKESHYYLQAGAFESSKLAEELKKKIQQYSKDAVFIAKINQQYLVRIGPFSDKKMSDGLKKALQSKGINGVFSMIM